MNTLIIDSPKSWTEDFDHENGKYICNCISCEDMFIGYKRRVICKECASLSLNEKLKEMRLRYGLPASAMSKVCGFGINQWRSYENGSEPSVSNLLLIQLIEVPSNFLRLLSIRSHVISEKQYEVAFSAASKYVTQNIIKSFAK